MQRAASVALCVVLRLCVCVSTVTEKASEVVHFARFVCLSKVLVFVSIGRAEVFRPSTNEEADALQTK